MEFTPVSQLTYAQCVAELDNIVRMMQGDRALIKEEVDAEDIADVVTRWTGIPVSKMVQT